MSGIVGIWNLDGRPVEEAVLARMSSTLSHRGPDGESRWLQGPLGLACQLCRVTPESTHETQPLADPSGAVVVFDGRLDNRDELARRLKDSSVIDEGASDPALVLAAYRAAGERLCEWLLGDFAFALFDPKTRQLLLARDAIGVRPLYYCRLQETVLFASEIKAILAHPEVRADPNEDQLAELLLVSVHDQELTLFQGIFSLPPAYRILVTPTRFDKQRYWDFDPCARIRLSSFQEYAEAFRHVFTQAVRRRLRSRHPVAVSLSGGLDSSAIFCVAQTLWQDRQAPAPAVFGASKTAPPGSRADEHDFVKMIEAACHISVHKLPIGPAAFVDDARRVVWHVEVPWLTETWNSLEQFHRMIRALEARVVLTGFWGDEVLCQVGHLVDLARQLRWGAVRTQLREASGWMSDVDPRWLRGMFWRDLIKYNLPMPLFLLARWGEYRFRRRLPWYSDALRQRVLRRQWRRLPVGRQFRTVYARSCYAEIRTGFRILCMEWDNKVAAMHGLEMALPFLDRDLLTFLMAIPGEIPMHQGVLKALLRESMRGLVPEPILQRRWKADFVEVVNDGARREFAKLAHEVASGRRAITRGYLNEQILTAQLQGLRQRLDHTAEAAWSLSDVLGLERWLEMFFDSVSRSSTTIGGGDGRHVPAESQETVPTSAVGEVR